MLIQAILTFLYGDMASMSEEKRKRVVQFLNRVMTTRADWRKQYLARGTFERRRDSGRPAKIMTGR